MLLAVLLSADMVGVLRGDLFQGEQEVAQAESMTMAGGVAEDAEVMMADEAPEAGAPPLPAAAAPAEPAAPAAAPAAAPLLPDTPPLAETVRDAATEEFPASGIASMKEDVGEDVAVEEMAAEGVLSEVAEPRGH